MNLEFTAMLLLTISLVLYAFGTVFIVCELGQRMTDAFGEISDAIGNFNWNLFPDDFKKMLPIIIQFAEQPVDIEFFGSISCSRKVFKKVCETNCCKKIYFNQFGASFQVLKGGFSYFTVLRKFNK